MIAIALTLQPHFVRLTRTAVMTEKTRDYVTVRGLPALVRPADVHAILPNCMAPLIVQATLSFSNAILDATSPGLPGHGRSAAGSRMGHHARRGARVHPARLVGRHFPGSCHPDHGPRHNLMGDGLRDALDPKLKRS